MIKFLGPLLDHFAWLVETLDTLLGFITPSPPHSTKRKYMDYDTQKDDLHGNVYYRGYIPGAILVWPTIIVSLIPEFKELSPVLRYTFFLSDDSMTALLLQDSRSMTQLINNLSITISNYSFRRMICYTYIYAWNSWRSQQYVKNKKKSTTTMNL